MLLYRIARRSYADLSGAGGLVAPGRWHEKGNPILYTATSIALACIEFALHSRFRPSDTMLLEIDLAASVIPTSVEQLIGGPLPRNWPSDHGHTRPIGTEWLIGKSSLSLTEPSIAVPKEINLLLNPGHKDFDGDVPAD